MTNSNRNANANIKFDYENKAIVITKKFQKQASVYNSAAFIELKEAMNQFPSFELVIRELSSKAKKVNNHTCFFSREDHIRLCEAIKEEYKRLKIFITYDNCDEVRDLYSFMPFMYDKEWNYCISRTDDQKEGKKLQDGHKGKREKGKELFILNY